MNNTTTSRAGTGATVARVILLMLVALFVLGAVAQFFLAGLAIFDTPTRWSDHETVGHIIGEVTYVGWIFAALGRAGSRVIVGSILLAILMGAQYAFVNAGTAWMQALHPLNGAVLFALSIWIAVATGRMLARNRSSAAPALAGQP